MHLLLLIAISLKSEVLALQSLQEKVSLMTLVVLREKNFLRLFLLNVMSMKAQVRPCQGKQASECRL